MRKSLKVLALLLVALFAISVFAGCKPSNDPVDGSSAVETQSDVTGSGSGEVDGEKDPDATGSDATGSQAGNNNEQGDTNSTASGNKPVLNNQTNSKKQKVNKTGWPIVKDKITISVMGIGLPAYGDAKNMSMFKWYEEKTNVKFDFEAIAGGEIAINQKKATVMQSGKFPDMFSFYTNTFSQFEIDKYGKEGAFVDVNEGDMLKTYAPKIYEELKNPIQVAQNIQSTGEIYTIPNKMINESFLDYDHWLNINKTWLDNLKLQVPTTMTELRNVLRAFRDGDPNRNGQKDELPMAIWIWNDATIINGWGIAGDISFDKKGKVYYGRTTENAHQACIYWNQILSEQGLMDKELDGSDGNGQYTKFINKIATGTVGVFNWSYITGWKKELLDQYIPIPYPTANFVNPELDLPKANQPFNSTPTRGCKIITRDCDYPEAVLRYYDYLYTDAGIMLANHGSPDNGYYKQKADGSYYLTEKAKGVDFAKNHGLSWTMRAPETNCMDKLLDKSEGTTNPHGLAYEAKAAEVYAAALKKDPRPAFIYNRTAEELAQLRKFSSFEGGGGHLSRYVEGYLDLAGWSTWVNGQKTNEEACIKLWQSIVNKHKSNLFLLDGDLKF